MQIDYKGRSYGAIAGLVISGKTSLRYNIKQRWEKKETRHARTMDKIAENAETTNDQVHKHACCMEGT